MESNAGTIGDGIKSDRESTDSGKSSLFKMPALAVKKKSGSIAKAFSENSGAESSHTNAAVALTNDTVKNGTDVSDDVEPQKQSESAAENEAKTKRSSKPKGFSPAERIKESEAVIPYKEPDWGGLSELSYAFEVVKNGIVVDKYDLSSKSYHVFGRLPSCDHSMDHPSLSRYHAVLQHCIVPASTENQRRVGWYLYDLDSTHGTWINKNKVPPRTYLPLRVGYVIKFGGSSRLHILQGPDIDQDEESDLSVAEMKAQRDRQQKETDVLRQLEAMEAEQMAQKKLRDQQDVGCMWGFDDDAEDAESDEDDSNTVSALPLQEELYIDDPKKALRGFFEREGWEMPEYDFTDAAKGQHVCRVEIPIDTPNGEPIVAEVTQTGSRKDAVVACALQACRILDRHGLLRKSTHESRAKKEKNWEEADFYDSDEDVFLDRTGDIEKKRQKRILKVKPASKTPETYETLMKKLEDVESELKDAEDRLEKDKREKEAIEEDAEDALDAFMMSMKSGGMDTRTRSQLKHRCVALRQQQQQLQRLAKVAQPCNLPSLLPKQNQAKDNKVDEVMQSASKSGRLPIISKMKSPAVGKPVLKPAPVQSVSLACDGDVEEDDDEENSGEINLSETQLRAEENVVAINDSSDQTGQPASVKSEAASAFVKKPVNPDIVNARKRKLEEKEKQLASSSGTKFDDNDPDYVAWVPPSNQMGDGRTHLNEKFGY